MASNSSTEVTLFSNGYVYPEDQSNGYGHISSSGLGAWVDRAGFTRVFFYPQQTGQINVALKAKAPDAANTLRVQLDGTNVTYDVQVPKSSSYNTIEAGSFDIISTNQYHYIEVKAVTKNSTYLPDIEAVVVSGPAATGLKYNESEHRGAPSTHLTYVGPASSAWFYSELSVPQGADPLHAYYMSNGFDGGYFGIQVNSATERRVLFSIWSNFNTDDPSQIPSEYAVTLIKKGADVHSGDFGNEGSGGQSYWKFMWMPQMTYKFLVHAEASGDHTIFTGYFYMPESASWKLIAQWDKGKTGGKLLSGLYSFVENFSSNGNDYFRASYGNQWVCSTNGTWEELTQATFTTTASPTVHQRYDYGSGAQGTWMYMYSGGFKEINNLTPGSKVQRSPTGRSPANEIDNLPKN